MLLPEPDCIACVISVAPGVIFKTCGVRLRVVEHRAVRRDPRQAEAVGVHGFEVVRAVRFHARDCQRQLILHLPLLHAAEVAVQNAHDEHDARQQHRARHQQDGAENSFCHSFASNR